MTQNRHRKNITHPTMALLSVAKPYAELVKPEQVRDIEPPAMLVPKVLPAGAVVGLTANPGVGKTWFAMEMMRAVATGDAALGVFTARPGGVLFIGSDSSIHDYARQWKRLTHTQWAQHQSEVEEGETAPDLYESVRWLIQSSFTLDNPNEVVRVIKTHDSHHYGPMVTKKGKPKWDANAEVWTTDDGLEDGGGFDLIVMDTFSRLYRGNQNDAEQTDRAMGHAKLIAEATGAAVLLLHHNAKKSEFNDGESWRGSSAMQGSLDAWLNLVPSKGDKYLIQGNWKKFRGLTPPDFCYRMEVSDPDTARLLYVDQQEAAGEINPLSDSITKTLSLTGKPMTSTEIVDALWPEYTDSWKSRESFRKAIQNRLYLGNNMSMANIKRAKNDRGHNIYSI